MPRIRFNTEEEARETAARTEGGSYVERNQSDGEGGLDKVYYVETPDDANPYADEGLEDWEYEMGKIPILNLLGGSAATDRAMNLREQREAQNEWDTLAEGAPTQGQLAVDYGTERTRDEWGFLDGPGTEMQGGSAGLAAQGRALHELQGISDAGGYTRADEMARNSAAMANGQRLQGANQAAMQQAEMRGMAGGGAEIGARLAGSQAYTQGQAMADAQIQQGAQARAMQALQAQGQIGSNMDSATYRRQGALDDYNNRQMNWRREREQRNNQNRNRGRESQADAYQQQYENAERRTAGKTDQYQAGQSNRRADGAREDAQGENLIEGIAGLLG